MLTTRIDLAHLDETQKQLLTDLLIQQSQQYRTVLLRDKTYSIERVNSSTLQTELVNISLSHDIVFRTRNKNFKRFRFEVIDHQKLIGEGGYSKVYDVMATISLDDYQLTISNKKERVVKIIQCTKDDLSNICAEVFITKRAGSLHIKSPVAIANDDGTYNVYLVMQKLHGTDLDAVMTQMYQNKLTISGYKRLGIGIDLLDQLIILEQQGIVHRDLKPNNILMDLNSKKLTIFDFGLSKFAYNDDKGEFEGTLGFIPFEVYAGEGTTFKADVYAAAINIALLFYGDEPEKSKDEFIEYQFDNLFKDPTLDFSENEKMEIAALLQNMTEINVDKRFSAKQARDALFKIRDDYINRQIAEMAAKAKPQYLIKNGLFYDINQQTPEVPRAHERSSCKF